MLIHSLSCCSDPGQRSTPKPCLHPGSQLPSSPATLAVGSAEHPKAYPSLWLSLRTVWTSDPRFCTSPRMEMACTVHCIHTCSPAPLHQLEDWPQAQPKQQPAEQAGPGSSPQALGQWQVFSIHCVWCLLPWHPSITVPVTYYYNFLDCMSHDGHIFPASFLSPNFIYNLFPALIIKQHFLDPHWITL